MPVADNLHRVQDCIASAAARSGRSTRDVTLVAVTKYASTAAVRDAFSCGLRHFGESRVQDARTKMAELTDIAPLCTWHMVGNLQSNKARAATELFAIIQSVASIDLGERIDRVAVHRIPVFLEVNVAGEATKRGFSPEALPAAGERLRRCPNLDVRGLMTVAPQVAASELARPIFRRLRELGESLGLPELSMGMTDDFEVAIEEGATMVRVGRAIFGDGNGG
jgi:pyridoxal phosphate enzyme (YggS family)